jgi:glycosyltransferase involved in cell wall biosynthesis
MAVSDSSWNGTDRQPLVTVAMPVYNAGKYLRLAVLSIVRQTFTDWELLIVDDGSTDDALQGIADIDDARIRILRDGMNKGLAARLNECIDLARGKYFARMDQDDVSYPERFKCQINALKKDPLLDLVTVRALAIGSDNEPISLFPYIGKHKEICARPWVGFYLPHPTWMGKTSWFREYRYTLPGPYYSEDMDLLLRSYKNSRFGMVPDVLFAYRVRRDIVWQKQIRARKAVFSIQLQAFSQTGQWNFVCLAALVLILRIAADCFRLTKQSMKIPSHRFEVVPENVRNDWNKLEGQFAKTDNGQYSIL